MRRIRKRKKKSRPTNIIHNDFGCPWIADMSHTKLVSEKNNFSMHLSTIQWYLILLIIMATDVSS
jgi:hypothetical protein